MINNAIRENSITLGVFGLITAILLATTYTLTADKIAAAERRVATRALLQILPADSHANDLLLDTVAISELYWPLLGLKNGGDIHIARNNNGTAIAVIAPAIAPDGYSGPIKLLVGIFADGSIAGVRAISHNETPGLGDKVDVKKSNWILTFNNKSLLNPSASAWKVKKDGGEFDQFTGATITPRAVVKQVAAVLNYFAADKAHLFKAAEKTATPVISPTAAVEVTAHE